MKANNSIEAERIAKAQFRDFRSINKIVQFKTYFTDKFWFTFCEDGVWVFASEYPYKTKRDAVDTLKCAKMDDRKRVISKVKDGYYAYNQGEGLIIRGDKVEEYGYLEFVFEWLNNED